MAVIQARANVTELLNNWVPTAKTAGRGNRVINCPMVIALTDIALVQSPYWGKSFTDRMTVCGDAARPVIHCIGLDQLSVWRHQSMCPRLPQCGG